MTIRRFAAVLLTLTALAAAAPALAQTAPATDDWDYGEDPARDLVIAGVAFDNFGVAVRCMGDSFGVLMTGLPTASGVRRLRYRFGDGQERESRWVSGPDSDAAYAVWPRSVANEFSAGGRLVVDAPDGEQTRRYVVDLPASPVAVGRVFQACGREQTPAAGALPPPSAEDFAGLRWKRRPAPRFPERARTASGMAALTCAVKADGGLRDCVVESEFPENGGFGRASALGTEQYGRLEPIDPSGPSMEGRSIIFVISYRLAGSGDSVSRTTRR